MTQGLSHQWHTGMLLESHLPPGQPQCCSPSNASLAPHYPEDNFKFLILALRVSWNPVPPSSSHHPLPSPHTKPKVTAAPPSRWGGDHPGKTTLGEPFSCPPHMHPQAAPLLGAHEMLGWEDKIQQTLTQG